MVDNPWSMAKMELLNYGPWTIDYGLLYLITSNHPE